MNEEFSDPKPVVINETLLQIGARNGLTESERERLEESEKNGNGIISLSPPDIKVLRLSYMHIRKIDNLQCYTSLQELNLSNNLITKIENLTTLVTLKKLDLSFNQISSFDGLETLVELEELSLFNNQIKKIEGFPILPKLKLLSLGRNKIEDLGELAHLFKLKALRVLTLTENPIREKEIFKLTVLAYLPNLRFLDYARVTAADIIDAKERNSENLNNLQQSDDYERVQQETKKAEEARNQLLRDSFLTKISNLHNSLFRKDSDHNKIRTISEIAEPYLKFTDDLKRTIESFVNEMIVQNRLLDEEESLFNQAYNYISEENRLQMVEIVKDLERRRRVFMESFNTEEEQTNETNESNENKTFLTEIDEIKDELFTEEFSLVDQVTEMIHMYETELDDRMNIINDKIILFFGSIRNLENDYNEKVMDICVRLWEKFSQGAILDVSDEIRSILVDKDSLLTTITQSHEHRTTKLYRRQEDITNMYKRKIEILTSNARQTDLERNRKRIAEISNYISNIATVIAMLEGGDDEND
ncbi:dynein regulatory complex subunit 3 [Histomonas meleagridis]|uniref:dynein regulatory complex subunit 3 n=1 Tax=Histomonas meleagridis TaxID=135588 RepID=UPI003559CA4D|nr:dynein regulatory complex subunit 3 [Histomonas meleagridis]KAH0802667.1 dynein regulatory complex subunit 3 [Histomonas meleagridis]